jgi:ferritin-like metal-binding protein YciE
VQSVRRAALRLFLSGFFRIFAARRTGTWIFGETFHMRLTSLKLESVEDLFLAELRDLFDAENQLLKALPKLAEAASAPALKLAFSQHFEETKGHVARLDRVFRELNVNPSGETCEAMKGLVKEGEEFIQAKGEPAVRDAGLIGAAQRVEHYEMAGYGTARTLAKRLGFQEIATVLQHTLEEEGEADRKLTAVAENEVNARATAAAP